MQRTVYRIYGNYISRIHSHEDDDQRSRKKSFASSLRKRAEMMTITSYLLFLMIMILIGSTSAIPQHYQHYPQNYPQYYHPYYNNPQPSVTQPSINQPPVIAHDEAPTTLLFSSPTPVVFTDNNSSSQMPTNQPSSVQEGTTESPTDEPVQTVYPDHRGLAKPAFIGLVVGLSLGALILLSAIVFICRRRNRRRYVRPEYKPLYLAPGDQKKSFDGHGGPLKFDRSPTTLLPARELLFPTQLSATHQKNIYGAKGVDTPVWDVKADVQRHGTIRIPKTRNNWFHALTSQRTQKKEKSAKSPTPEDRSERARKTNSWLAAFKKSSGINIGGLDDDNTPPTKNEKFDLPNAPPAAASKFTSAPRTVSPELKTPDNQAAENAKKAFLAGLDLRDSRKPKTPNVTTTAAATTTTTTTTRSSNRDARKSRALDEKNLALPSPDSNNSTVSSAGGPRGRSRDRNLTRRETIRQQGGLKATGSLATRRSMRLAKNNVEKDSASATTTTTPPPPPPLPTTITATTTTTTTTATTTAATTPSDNNDGENNQLKRQTLFGQGEGMLAMDLDRSPKSD